MGDQLFARSARALTEEYDGGNGADDGEESSGSDSTLPVRPPEQSVGSRGNTMPAKAAGGAAAGKDNETSSDISGPTTTGPLPEREPAKKRIRTHQVDTHNLASPKQRAEAIPLKEYVTNTMRAIRTQPNNMHTTIADAFDIPITGNDFASLEPGQMLNDNVINWILAWWTSQVGGRSHKNFGRDTLPNLPRCFYTSTQWYASLTQGGTARHQNVSGWTKRVNVFKDFDLMLIPINIKGRHWYLAVIDFIRKATIVFDSHESPKTINSQTPGMADTHTAILTWMAAEHTTKNNSPFPTHEWKTLNSYTQMGPTPQQGTSSNPGRDCGFFTIAFAMQISLGHTRFDFVQNDIPTIRNWIAYNIIMAGMKNKTYGITSLSSSGLSEYEEKRNETVAKNHQIFESLGFTVCQPPQGYGTVKSKAHSTHSACSVQVGHKPSNNGNPLPHNGSPTRRQSKLQNQEILITLGGELQCHCPLDAKCFNVLFPLHSEGVNQVIVWPGMGPVLR